MTPTLDTLTAHLGLVYTWPVKGLAVHVRCLDARLAYGKVQLQITPLRGTGRTWVDLTSLTPDPGEERAS